jgi:retinol dehydrogenase-12
MLVERGMHVILACRNASKAIQVMEDIAFTTKRPELVEVMELELGSISSVNKFATDFLKKDIPLHALILNAGFMAETLWHTDDGFESMLHINYLGHFLLSYLLEDKLVASSPSRVVSLTSAGHEGGILNFDNLNSELVSESEFNGLVKYCDTKLMNVAFANQLHDRLYKKGVMSVSVHPGMVATEFQRLQKLDSTLACLVLSLSRTLFPCLRSNPFMSILWSFKETWIQRRQDLSNAFRAMMCKGQYPLCMRP